MKKLFYFYAWLIVLPYYVSADSLSVKTGYPVLVGKDTLFLVYSRVGSFTAIDRANAVTFRIKQLIDEPFFQEDSLYQLKSESSTDIFYKDRILISITNEDAQYYGKESQETAKDYLYQLKIHIKKYKEQNSFKNTLINISMVLAIILLVGIFMLLFKRLFGYIQSLIEKDGFIRGIEFRSYQLLSARKQLLLMSFMLKMVKVGLLIFAIYIILPVLFSVFPSTRHHSEYLFSLLIIPLKKISLAIWNYLPSLLTIITIVIVFIYVIKLFRILRDEISREQLKLPNFHTDWAEPTFNIIRFFLLAFMFILIFPYLPGSDSPVFQGVSVFIGFVFSMGSSSFVSNILAGFSITYMRKFKVGDRIKINDVSGDVIERSLLVTRIRTIKNEDIIIPNSNILSSHTINYSNASQSKGLILHTTMTIGYDVPWKKVHELMINAAKNTKGILQDPQPYVYQTSLDDFYVSYQINAFTDQPNGMAAIYSELHQNIQDQFNHAKVEILSPHYHAIRDGSHVTIDPMHLPPDYTAPTFNIKST